MPEEKAPEIDRVTDAIRSAQQTVDAMNRRIDEFETEYYNATLPHRRTVAERAVVRASVVIEVD